MMNRVQKAVLGALGAWSTTQEGRLHRFRVSQPICPAGYRWNGGHCVPAATVTPPNYGTNVTSTLHPGGSATSTVSTFKPSPPPQTFVGVKR